MGVIGFDSVCFSEEKRAEEGNDDLVNHPLQKINADESQQKFALAA